MRGVGHELALGDERRFEAPEQLVEGVRELRDLVVGAVEGETLVQARGGDGAGALVDRAQGAQQASGGDPAEPDRGGGHDRERDPGLLEELVQLGGVLLARERLVALDLRPHLLGGERSNGPAAEPRSEQLAPCVRRAGHRGFAECEAAAVRPGADEDAVRRVAHQYVGDRKQADAGGEEQSGVDDREPKPDGAAGQPVRCSGEVGEEAHAIQIL